MAWPSIRRDNINQRLIYGLRRHGRTMVTLRRTIHVHCAMTTTRIWRCDLITVRASDIRSRCLWFYLQFDSSYRAMLCRARLCYSKSSVCLSVCPSVTLRYDFHISWNTSKIISRPNSLRPMRLVNPTWAIWCNGNTPKFGGDQRWGGKKWRAGAWSTKAAISQKRVKIEEKLLWRAYRNH